MVVKVAFLVGILYLMGLIKGRRETPSEDEEIWEMGADSNDPEYHGGEKPNVEIPKLEPPMLDPPNIELPILEQADAENVADDAAAQHLLHPDGDEIKDIASEEEEKKEKKRLEEKEEEKAEDKELDLVVAPPKRPEGPGEMGKPYKVGEKYNLTDEKV